MHMRISHHLIPKPKDATQYARPNCKTLRNARPNTMHTIEYIFTGPSLGEWVQFIIARGLLRANQRERTNVLNCLTYKEEGKHSSIYTRVAPRPGPLVPGTEHPEPDVVLRSGPMTGAFGSRPEKAPVIPPNDVEILRAKPRAVTSVK
ncbi:hypothetical protein K440DRAFT_639438 [Wilcoxina mikolae CBS 423.85]|nr:hypothetical protein K440DRAFT_639438 [Wilcoxina mikolae CBS 423.85]